MLVFSLAIQKGDTQGLTLDESGGGTKGKDVDLSQPDLGVSPPLHSATLGLRCLCVARSRHPLETSACRAVLSALRILIHLFSQRPSGCDRGHS